MSITRRRFLGYAAGAVTVGLRGLPLDPWRPGRRECVLLDLQEHGCLGESVLGYQSALTGAGVRVTHADARWVSPSRCALLIVPTAQEIPPGAVRAILSCLQEGASVILESGAGFASPRGFRAHRLVLRESLQVRVEAPVPLWLAHTRSGGIPYVDYTWPCSAKVRDFSRVVPLGRQTGEVIAWVDDLPVALKRQAGRGTLIFLGSPLGPALWAGDAEARRWLVDCLGEA
jgi:hypothetical protein